MHAEKKVNKYFCLLSALIYALAFVDFILISFFYSRLYFSGDEYAVEEYIDFSIWVDYGIWIFIIFLASFYHAKKNEFEPQYEKMFGLKGDATKKIFNMLISNIFPFALVFVIFLNVSDWLLFNTGP